MTEKDKEILELIKIRSSLNDIKSKTKLTNAQIYKRISNICYSGYGITRRYHSNGDIVYNIADNPLVPKKDSVDLYSNPIEYFIKIMLISDLHLGNERERIDALNKIYDYCAKNDINVIINVGDLIDGSFGYDGKLFDNLEDMVQYAIKVYPYDKNIINFLCLGNHDIDSVYKTGLDIRNIIYNQRHDIIPVGYGFGKINIKNDQLIVRHPLHGRNLSKVDDVPLVICGHSHTMLTSNRDNDLKIIVPSLSDMNNNMPPSAISMRLFFKNGYFCSTVLEQLIVTDKIYVINRSEHLLNPSKTFGQKTIILQEFRKTKSVKEELKNEEENDCIQNEFEDSFDDNFHDNPPIEIIDEENRIEQEGVGSKVKTLSRVDKFKKKYNL